MNNQSLANKYRPGVFADVLGQEAVVRSLQGKLLENRLPRTALFCGAHGSGKTTLARIAAKAVNCQHPKEDGNPCCECESCRSIDSGVSTDVIEMDAASHNKVEDAEQIVKQAAFLPTGKKKVIILDEFHMMTKEAQNKLLKVVEEPPAHVHFIFCTTEERRILPTILSRCNKFTFRGISSSDIFENLKKICDAEGFEYDEDALKLIVKSADGHVRDSLSVLEQLSYEKLTAERVAQTLGLASHEQVFTLLQSVVVEDVKGMLTFLEEIFSLGNIQAFLKEVVYVLCYLLTYDPQTQDGETEEFRQQIRSLKEHISSEKALAFIKIITQALKDNRGMGLELATRIAFLSMLSEVRKESRIAMLEEEIKLLKQQLLNPAAVAQPLETQPLEANVMANEVSMSMETSLPSMPELPEPKSVPSDTSTMGYDVPELPWPSEVPFDGVSGLDGFEPIPATEVNSVIGVESLMGMPAQQDVSVPENTTRFEIPGGVIASEEVSASAENTFSIPGGVIASEEQVEVQKDDTVKEAPVTGGFNDGGFGSSFSGGLFGPTGVSFFG